MRKYGERIFGAVLAVAITVMLCTNAVMAEYKTENGATMWYYLDQSGNSWDAKTYCYEGEDSMVSLFIYDKKNGTLLKSDSVKGRDNIPVPGSSATRTYAHLNFSNSSAKYGRSSHALLFQGENRPCISARELDKSK